MFKGVKDVHTIYTEYYALFIALKKMSGNEYKKYYY